MSSQKFLNINVASQARLNDVVFKNMLMSGETYCLSTSKDISLISSNGNTVFSGDNNVTLDSSSGSIYLQSGVNDISDGNISIGHSNGKPVIQFLYDFKNKKDKLGFYGKIPVSQPVIPSDATIEDIKDALSSLGLIKII